MTVFRSTNDALLTSNDPLDFLDTQLYSIQPEIAELWRFSTIFPLFLSADI